MWSRPGDSGILVTRRNVEEQIFYAHLDLLSLAGSIINFLQGLRHPSCRAFLAVQEFEKELERWYRELPDELRWEDNQETALPSFFILQ